MVRSIAAAYERSGWTDGMNSRYVLVLGIASADEAAGYLPEEQVRRDVRRLYADDDPRDVDAFGNHRDGDDPAAGAGREF